MVSLHHPRKLRKMQSRVATPVCYQDLLSSMLSWWVGLGEDVFTIGYLSYLHPGHLPAGITHCRDPHKKKTMPAAILLCLCWNSWFLEARGSTCQQKFHLPFCLWQDQSPARLYCGFSKTSLLSTSWKNLDAMPSSPSESYPSTVAWWQGAKPGCLWENLESLRERNHH